MFSVIKTIYNKKTKGPTLIELFTATGKLEKVFWQLQMFDVYTTGNMAHIDTIFKCL
jgi:cytochrome c biogenesis protein ResB